MALILAGISVASTAGMGIFQSKENEKARNDARNIAMRNRTRTLDKFDEDMKFENKKLGLNKDRIMFSEKMEGIRQADTQSDIETDLRKQTFQMQNKANQSLFAPNIDMKERSLRRYL